MLLRFSAEPAFSVAILFDIFVCTAFAFVSHHGIRTAVSRLPPDDPQLRSIKADVRDERSVAGDRGRAGNDRQSGPRRAVFRLGRRHHTVSASLSAADSGVQVAAFIGSVKMPTDTSGINNIGLPLDGQFQPFTKFTRYFAVPASHRYSGTLQSNINQCISVQFKENSATVNIVNRLVDPSNAIKFTGNCQSQVTINAVANQTYGWSFQGNGRQIVWINADSCQNSQSANIAVQSLSSLYAAYTVFANRSPAASCDVGFAIRVGRPSPGVAAEVRTSLRAHG